ncbi:hypothetical protein DC20_18350 [Rufibacter tibetensis]|uniref:Uncharacterized protein n=1 Tax=Rufibacter tibetensis TaxID=512763 RepID=A0A0P0D187_9BACT|nr:hypothetical protein DC20_18350 [Rufibacter tibetensis]
MYVLITSSVFFLSPPPFLLIKLQLQITLICKNNATKILLSLGIILFKNFFILFNTPTEGTILVQ